MIGGVTGSRRGAAPQLLAKFRHDLKAFRIHELHVGARDYDDRKCWTDAQCACIARDAGIPVKFHPPDFDKHGSPAAYHIRNGEVVTVLRVNHGILFHFPGGRGTKSTVGKAEKAKVRMRGYEKKEE